MAYEILWNNLKQVSQENFVNEVLSFFGFLKMGGFTEEIMMEFVFGHQKLQNLILLQ
jgi:hypothetical protein